MTDVASRLAAAGLQLPSSAPPPAGLYSTAVRHAGLILTSGQVPLRDGVLLLRGRVGAEVDPTEAAEGAAIAALNALAAVETVACLDDVLACLSLRVFVAAVPDVTDLVRIADGASAVVAVAFPDAPLPARTAVGVCSLPLGAPVEVELVFTRTG